jgi:hypothetical protein
VKGSWWKNPIRVGSSQEPANLLVEGYSAGRSSRPSPDGEDFEPREEGAGSGAHRKEGEHPRGDRKPTRASAPRATRLHPKAARTLAESNTLKADVWLERQEGSAMGSWGALLGSSDTVPRLAGSPFAKRQEGNAARKSSVSVLREKPCRGNPMSVTGMEQDRKVSGGVNP